MLAYSDEHDGRLGAGDGGKSAAALGRAVHLGKYDRSDPDRVMEGLGLRSGLLPHAGVEDQYPLRGIGDLANRLDLVDEVAFQSVPSGSIDYYHVEIAELLHSGLDDVDRRPFGR